MSDAPLRPEQYEQSLFDRGFERSPFSFHGTTRDVYRLGEGPPVILLSELPGITPQTLDLAQRIVRAGYRVVMPQLFGRPGAPMTPREMFNTLGRVCISREFAMLAEREESPITDWLRGLARHEHKRAGGRGVGVIGMCFTGGFALAMALDESVMAPVLSQPSLPFPFNEKKACAVGLDDDALVRIRQRCVAEDIRVLGLRFTGDRASPKQRFDTLQEKLGDRFVRVEIDSSFGNKHDIKPWAHSVLTLDYKDDPSHPTYGAFQKVLELFAAQLR